MELLFSNDEIHIYDDFAHHPTAIKKTIEGLRNRVGSDPIHCLLEMRSNTMSGGFHDQEISRAVEKADFVHIFSKNKSQALGIAKKAKNIVPWISQGQNSRKVFNCKHTRQNPFNDASCGVEILGKPGYTFQAYNANA